MEKVSEKVGTRIQPHKWPMYEAHVAMSILRRYGVTSVLYSEETTDKKFVKALKEIAGDDFPLITPDSELDGG